MTQLNQETDVQEMDIDFAAINGEDSANHPQGLADKTLSTIAPGQSLKTFSCRDGLTDRQLDQVKQYALKLRNEWKLDRTQLSSFGNGSMEALNQTVSKILGMQGDLRIPEVERITKEMAKSVSDFKRKYSDADPKFLEALEKFVDSIAGIFKAGERFFKEMQIDSQKAVTRLDGVAKQLIETKGVLDRNVVLCDELYDDNEKGLANLIGTIAIKEEVLDLYREEASLLKSELDAMPSDKSTVRRAKEEELNTLLEMIEELEVRRSEFVSRLFVAWVTAPQIRNLRKVSNSLSQRLNLLVLLTIPVMKLTIAQLGMQVQAKNAGAQIEAVHKANNDALEMLAEVSGENIPVLASLSQNPSSVPQTIMALAESVDKQNKGIVDSFAQGQIARAELDHTIVVAIGLIDTSTEESQAKIIELVTRAKKPLQLEAAPDIPEVVTEYAEQQKTAA